MHKKIEILNPISSEKWDDMLYNTENSSIFHSAAWAKVLHETYGCTPYYFTVHDNNKFHVLIPVLEIKSIYTGIRGVSLPFTDYCNPIINDDFILNDILQEVYTYGRKKHWKYFEIRGAKNYLEEQVPAAIFYEHNMNLQPEHDHLRQKMKSNHKRNIKRAQKAEIQISFERSSSAMRVFYKLQCLTRKRHGLPPQPFKFFENIYKYIIHREMGDLVFAIYKEKRIACSVFFHFGKNVLYKFGASDFIYNTLGANHLVMWEAIKRYAKNKYARLSFGRTSLHSEGLRRFKIGWGSTEGYLNYYRYDLLKNEFIETRSKEVGIHNRVFRNMPIPISRFIGARLYKHHG